MAEVRLFRSGDLAGGGVRIDLITDSAPEFYAAPPHRRFDGVRIYPRIETSKA